MSDRDAVDNARLALRAAERERARRRAALAFSEAMVARARRALSPDDPALQQVEAERAAHVAGLERAHRAEEAARAALDRARRGWLEPEPSRDLARLDGEVPIVLLPVRLETRFMGAELWVRVYPDSICADLHDPALTPGERDAGEDFWRRAWRPDGEADAWRRISRQMSPWRAAWVIRATEPVNAAERPAGEPGFGEPAMRAHTWSTPAHARLLPDRWILRGYRGGDQVLAGVSRPVQEPLALTLSGGTLEGEQVDLDGLRVDAAAAWTYDFARAEEVGMAVKLPLGPEDRRLGLDRLLCIGVKTSLDPRAGGEALSELLDNHRFSRGLSLLPQGTPTNNTSGAPAGPSAPADAIHALERAAPGLADGSDGDVLARCLGLPARVVAPLDGARGQQQASARAMNQALWPATLGYFLDQMMAPELDEAQVAAVRDHFVRFVSGRGPCPALRVGDTPYGVLPVSSLAGWRNADRDDGIGRELPGLLRRLLPIWRAGVDKVPRIGRTGDGGKDLLEVLGMDASARQVYIRESLGKDTTSNLLRFAGLPDAPWHEAQRRLGRAVMDLVGRPEWEPRVLGMTYGAHALLFRDPLVTGAPSETEPLPFDFVRWVRTATIEQLRTERVPDGVTAPRSLLYRMLRHAVLQEYWRVAATLLVQHNLMDRRERREPELIGVVPGTLERKTVWQRLAEPIPRVSEQVAIGDYLAAGNVPRGFASLSDYRSALRGLEGLPSAELERLFSESLDVCSHRIDAWIGSLVARRLADLRHARPLDSFVGAYGWLEDLRPAALRRRARGSLGHIHAPSMAHAATASILRNAFATRPATEAGSYAIDLSSARTRAAHQVLDAVRQGQALGAVLGYRFERALHERHLDRYIEPFRALYPLVAGKQDGAAEPAEPTDRIAARNVVDGLRLRTAWAAGEVPWAAPLPATGPARGAIEAELVALDDAIDAVADLLTAEAVFQVVQGNTEAGMASVEAIARGHRPPEPEVSLQPRGGVGLTHRVAAVVGGAGGATWPAARSERARAEPNLERLAGRLLGDPGAVRCRVTYPRPTPADPDRRVTREVTLAELEIAALDVLSLADAVDPDGGTSELDRRVAWVVLDDAPPDATVEITYAPDPAWDRATVRSFPELLELARAARAVIGGARPLRPEDLLLPEQASEVEPAQRMPEDLSARATALRARLASAISALDAALTAVASAAPDASPPLDALRAALQAAAAFGVPGAFPTSRVGSTPAARRALESQATAALAELRRREAAATGDGAAFQAILGREFAVLPRFRPPGRDELARALTAGPSLLDHPRDLIQWIQRASCVQPGLARWRRVELLARAMGAAPSSFELAQLPHRDGARWVGLPFPPEGRPPSGSLSLVLERSAAPAVDQPWAGLLLEEWVEVIPNDEETTAIAFHYDNPNAEAPQAILVAVTPPGVETWSVDLLLAIAHETLDLAKVRAVDGELLGRLGQLLPAIHVSANSVDDAISSPLLLAVAQQVTIAMMERR